MYDLLLFFEWKIASFFGFFILIISYLPPSLPFRPIFRPKGVKTRFLSCFFMPTLAYDELSCLKIPLKKILVFGAGKSATSLIDFLLQDAPDKKRTIIVADSNEGLIRKKLGEHPSGKAAVIDIHDAERRKALIEDSDIVISLMPPSLHILIARDCLAVGRHLLTASYADAPMLALSEEADKKRLLFLCEMGLDPGIDHMSAMELIGRIRNKGGVIRSFRSHCGGLVAPESDDNPWRYKVSWNPRNVVIAGKQGAEYLADGKQVREKYEDLFDPLRTVSIEASGVNALSFYPNRNSLPYIELYGLQDAETFMRTTLRYPEFMQGWKHLVDLQLTDEQYVYDTAGKSLQEFFREHLHRLGFEEWLQKNLMERFRESQLMLENLLTMMEEGEEASLPENIMIIDGKGELRKVERDELRLEATANLSSKLHEANLIIRQLLYLGLDDEKTMIDRPESTAADVLQMILEKKLALSPSDKDMVVMLHEIEYELQGERRAAKSLLLVKGKDADHTAMAATVGLPLGIAADLILQGKIEMTGVQIPTHEKIYEPVLKALNSMGIGFRETDEKI